MKTILPISGTLLALVLAAPLFSAENAEHGKGPMTEQLEPLKGGEFEAAFLAHMIHHHRSGVEMARLVEKQSKRHELHQLAEKIITAQRREIAEMTGWLKEWHSKTPEDFPQPAEAKAMMKADMEALGAAKDGEFDKLFIDKMSMHHREAIAMSKLVPERTKKAELEKAAKKMISDQTAEIEKMQSRKKEWF